MTKTLITAEDIKANIYEDIELIADISGLTNNNVAELEKEFSMLFDANEYMREITEMYSEELNDYQKRNDIILNLSKANHILEKESVLRYHNKNRTEWICICTKFLLIKLDYKEIHCLREKISLLSSMLNCCCKIKYFNIQKLIFRKNNAIICGSLYRLFQCFERKMFGDISYRLKEKSEVYKLKNSNIIEYQNYLVSVNKEVSQGLYYKDVSYRGALQIEVGTNAEIGVWEIKKETFENEFSRMNDIIFEIFMEHITNRFAEDLVKGSTDKVKGGFKNNEGF